MFVQSVSSGRLKGPIMNLVQPISKWMSQIASIGCLTDRVIAEMDRSIGLVQTSA
jgi:hypothetical protein